MKTTTYAIKYINDKGEIEEEKVEIVFQSKLRQLIETKKVIGYKRVAA